MLIRYERVEKQKIKTRPQPRKPDDPAARQRLAESLLEGQLQPVGLMTDYTMIWGRRRLDAAMSVNQITHLWAAVFESEITEQEFLRLRAVENFARQDLSAYEKWQTCEELRRLHPQ